MAVKLDEARIRLLKTNGTTTIAGGHVYLTGSSASSSTGNTTQLVFGTSSSNHVVLSSNDNALVINPTTSSTTNQIVLYLNQKAKFPSGIDAGTGGITTAGAISATGNISGNYIQGTWLYTSAATAQTTASKIAVIHSDGYIYYITPANLTTLIKDNASGTWAISISGNAATASSVAWGNVTGKPSTFTPSSHTHSYIASKGNYTFDSSTLPNSFDLGLSCGFVDANSGFGSYGGVITHRAYSGGGGSLQLYSPYSSNYGGTHLKARFGNYSVSSGNSWTDLKEIAWVSDIPTKISQLTNDASGTWGISISENAATASKVGASTSWLYFHNSNELNFGGSNTSTTIYFGYRAVDSRAIPAKFIFGGSTGSANLQCKTVYLGSGTSSYISSTQYTGNAATATAWANAQTLTLAGDLSGSVSIKGNAGMTLTATVNDDSHNHVISNVDGLQAALDNKASGVNYVDITVGGDANTYYPVVLANISHCYPMQLVNISRNYSETAPDTWNTSTHRGGLTLTLFWNGSRYWDGNGSGGPCHCIYKYESYCTMVGGLGNSTNGIVVWLRGGTAVYHIHSLNGKAMTATVYLSTFTDSASQSFAPKTTPAAISVRWPGTADSAASVAWGNVSGKPSTFTPSSHTHDYLPLSGGTLTGKLQVNAPIFGYNYTNGNNVAAFIFDKPGSNYTGIGACAETDTIYFGACDTNGAWNTSYRQKWKFNGSLIVGGGDDNCNIVPWTNNYSAIGTESLKWYKIYATNIYGDKVYGAVWNDYAEFRWVLNNPDTDEPIESGRCVAENGNDSMSLTHNRLQAGARIISDTYGMCMGETEKAKTPIAVCGRVLAYPFERKVAFNVGDPVCSGPNGTVSKMSREEAMMYPERIVGTVVSKPTYKEWGPNKIPVKGRIWIQVR